MTERKLTIFLSPNSYKTSADKISNPPSLIISGYASAKLTIEGQLLSTFQFDEVYISNTSAQFYLQNDPTGTTWFDSIDIIVVGDTRDQTHKLDIDTLFQNTTNIGQWRP